MIFQLKKMGHSLRDCQEGILQNSSECFIIYAITIFAEIKYMNKNEN